MATASATPARAFRDRLRIDFVFMQADCLTLENPSLAILRPLSQSCGKLKRGAELGWRDADHTPEDLCEMARAAVAHFETNIDKAARSFADQLLGKRDSLAGDKLQRSHASRLLENMREVRGAQFHQFSESFNRDFLSKMLGDVILDLAELTNG